MQLNFTNLVTTLSTGTGTFVILAPCCSSRNFVALFGQKRARQESSIDLDRCAPVLVAGLAEIVLYVYKLIYTCAQFYKQLEAP